MAREEKKFWSRKCRLAERWQRERKNQKFFGNKGEVNAGRFKGRGGREVRGIRRGLAERGQGKNKWNRRKGMERRERPEERNTKQ